MTWRELFRRAWLVLRLRFKTFVVCEDCGQPSVKPAYWWGTPAGYSNWIDSERCPACGWLPLSYQQTYPGAPIRVQKLTAIGSAIGEIGPGRPYV